MFSAYAALGIGSGGMLKSMVEGASRPWTAIGLACGAGLLLSGTAASLAVPFAAIIAAAAFAILAVQLLGRRAAAMQPA